ncbi:hypothetical protein MY11210_006430 [Beauveria gryllotalpidicola]
MDPRSKFVTPQPAAPTFAEMSKRRTGTAAPALSTNFVLSKDRPDSATSPKSPWRRFFYRPLISRSSESRDRSNNGADRGSLISATSNCDPRPPLASEGARTRDMSPASLRRLLVAEVDTSMRPVSRGSFFPSARACTPPVDVLDQVDEEDDDNFVGASDDFPFYAVEEPLFTTRLSPPPFRRDPASSSSTQTVVPSPRSLRSALQSGEDVSKGPLISSTRHQALAKLSMPESPSLSSRDTLHSRCPSSTLSSAMNSPTSPTLEDFPLSSDFSSFDGESQDDDDDSERSSCPGHEDVRVGNGAARINKHVKSPSTASFSRYRLPQLTFSTDKLPGAEDRLPTSPRFTTMTSPLLLPPSSPPVGGNGDSNLLGLNLGTGFDFASELTWITDSITSRR